MKPIFVQLGGGTPLDSYVAQVAGEEAFSPAGGARGDGGDVEGGTTFSIKKDFNKMLRGLTRRPRHLHIAWRRLRVAQWTPADIAYPDCWSLV